MLYPWSNGKLPPAGISADTDEAISCGRVELDGDIRHGVMAPFLYVPCTKVLELLDIIEHKTAHPVVLHESGVCVRVDDTMHSTKQRLLLIWSASHVRWSSIDIHGSISG